MCLNKSLGFGAMLACFDLTALEPGIGIAFGSSGRNSGRIGCDSWQELQHQRATAEAESKYCEALAWPCSHEQLAWPTRKSFAASLLQSRAAVAGKTLFILFVLQCCYTHTYIYLHHGLPRPHDFITRLDARASTLSRSELWPLQRSRSQLHRRLDTAVRAMQHCSALFQESCGILPRVEQTLFRLEPSPQQDER